MVFRSAIRKCLLPVLTAVGLALQSSSLFAVPFGNVIPGAGVIHVPVRSMVGMHFVHVVRQRTDFSCGAASLATILKYGFGQDVTEKSVMKGLFTVSNPAKVRKVGFSLLDIKNYVEKIGLKGQGYQVSPAQLVQIHIPVIVLLDLGGYRHFVVLEKTTATKMYLADPALGNRVMSKKAFLMDWNGIVFAVFGKGFVPHSVLLTPVKAPSALRLLHGIMPSAPLHAAHRGYDNVNYF